MSVAARTAVLLDEHLRAHPGVFGRAAQAAVGRCGAAAWLIATGADSRYPSTTGTTPRRRDRLSHWYLDRASDVANRDPYVSELLTDVLHLVAAPTALTRPGAALRVLRGRRGRQLWTPPERPTPASPA